MEQSTPPPKIYSAIVAIMGETKAITKSEFNQQQRFRFRGIDNVMNELHGLFAKHGVFILPQTKVFDVSEKVTKNGTIMYYTRATIAYRFVTDDGSYVETVTVGEAMDSGDKGMNKAMSIALKYALMQMLLIPTEEDKDPDRTTPEETRPRTIQEVIDTLNPETDALLIAALTDLNAATDKQSILDVWKRYPELQKNPVFSKCGSTKRKELGL